MIFTGLYLVLPSFTELKNVVLLGLKWVLPGFKLFLLGFKWAVPSFTGFYLVLPSFTGFYLVLLGFK